MKRYSSINLLVAGTCIFATFLAGCAGQAVQETTPPQAHLFLGQGTSGPQPGVEVETIYRADDPSDAIALTSASRDLWLKPGNYVATVSRCNEQVNSEAFTRYGVRIGPDHLFHFSVGGRRKYELGCSTSPDGTIYVRNDEL